MDDILPIGIILILIISAVTLGVIIYLEVNNKKKKTKSLVKNILSNHNNSPAKLNKKQASALKDGVYQGSISKKKENPVLSTPKEPTETDKKGVVDFLDKHKGLLIALPVQVIASIVLKKIIEKITGRVQMGLIEYSGRVAARVLEKMGVKLGEKALTRLGIRAAERLAVSAGTSLAAQNAVALSTGPGYPFVEAALLAFDVLSLSMDAGDGGGYNKMGTNSMYIEMKKGIDDAILQAYSEVDPPINLPVVSGPMDSLSSEDISNLFQKKVVELISAKDSKYMAAFNSALVEYLKKFPNASEEDIKKFSDDNMSLIDNDKAYSDALELSCIDMNGKNVEGGKCSWATKESCDSSYTWPPPEEKTDYHYSEWKDDKCVAASYGMRGICDSNNIEYDFSTGSCKIDEDYCKRKGAEWKDGDCDIPVGQEVAEAIFGITITRGLKQIFDPKQYEDCKSGETDDGYFCRKEYCDDNQDKDVGFCYPKCKTGFSGHATICIEDCPQGWTDDGLTCRKEFCGDNQYSSGGLCYDHCKDGYTKSGLICYQNCRDGYNSTLGLCTRPTQSYDRGGGRIPDKRDCPNGQRDDGTSCWEDIHCETHWDSCLNKTFWGACLGGVTTSCSGCGCIKQRLSDRQYCRDDEEMKDGLCYKKCADGYTAGATTCTKFADSYIPDSYGGGVGTPAIHIKSRNTYDRGVGTVATHVRAKARKVPYSSKSN